MPMGKLLARIAIPGSVARLVNSAYNLVGPTYEYARIILISEPFLIFNFAANFLIRGEGKARVAMVAISSGVLLNIVLDPLFIFGFGWGMGGAALATLFGHMLTSVFSVAFFIRGRGAVRVDRASLRPRVDLLRETIAIGASGFVRQISTGVVQIIRNNLIVAAAGVLAVSAYGVVFRTILIMAMPAMGIAQAIPPIAGYNFGAGNAQRVRQSVRLAIAVSSAIMWVGLALMELFPAWIFRVFTTDAELIATGVPFMRIGALALLVFPTYFIGTAFYQAIGEPKRALALAVSRPLFALIFMLVGVRAVGTIGVIAADPMAIAIGALSVLAFLVHSFRTDRRLAVRATG